MGRKYTLDLTNIMTDSHEKYYWLGFQLEMVLLLKMKRALDQN